MHESDNFKKNRGNDHLQLHLHLVGFLCLIFVEDDNVPVSRAKFTLEEIFLES